MKKDKYKSGIEFTDTEIKELVKTLMLSKEFFGKVEKYVHENHLETVYLREGKDLVDSALTALYDKYFEYKRSLWQKN